MGLGPPGRAATGPRDVFFLPRDVFSGAEDVFSGDVFIGSRGLPQAGGFLFGLLVNSVFDKNYFLKVSQSFKS